MAEHDGRWTTCLPRGAALVGVALGGGAALTLLAAAPAHAGDATSTGNRSSSDQQQQLLITHADPTVATVDGDVSNVGRSGANTGVNGTLDGEDVVVPGDATSTGNQAEGHLHQKAGSTGSGGGLTLLAQDARIRSWGGALADTGSSSGGDVTTGDAAAFGSRSVDVVDQDASADGWRGGLRVIGQRARLINLGRALAETGRDMGEVITTGNASAGGNEARTQSIQRAAVTGDPVAAAMVDQVAHLRNLGRGVAVTGADEVTDEDAENLAQVFQDGVLADEDTGD